MAIYCPHCGATISEAGRFCTSCGQPASIPASPTGAAAQPAREKNEPVILQEADVTVTTARFIVGGQTYAMSGITAVRSFVYHPSIAGPIILIILGVLGLLIGPGVGARVFGLLLAVGGVFWLTKKKPTYSVLLSSSSGEHRALSHKDGTYINRIVGAVNEAIVQRG
jgi:hypothetical protein